MVIYRYCITQKKMYDQKINLKYVLTAVITVIFTWITHEFSHWITSELLGYKSIMRLNSVSAIEEKNLTEWHKACISAVGPQNIN